MAQQHAPVDPRTPPPLGSLPVVARVDDVALRVVAANPSPMTLDGTNTYLLGTPGEGTVAVVDPGPDTAAHLQAVEAAAADLDAEPCAVLVTHHHVDHREAAPAWAARWGVPVVAARPDVAGPGGRVVADGDVLEVGGLQVDVVATPGHTRDSLSFRLPTGALCTGDHLLGRGTTVVAHPDGDLAAYLDSLRRVLDLGPDLLLPGHGPEMGDDPSAVVRFHEEHRAMRVAQVRDALAAGAGDARAVVEQVYADVDRRLWGAAEASTRAARDLLAARGEVELRDGRARVVP